MNFNFTLSYNYFWQETRTSNMRFVVSLQSCVETEVATGDATILNIILNCSVRHPLFNTHL